ncbi:MAG: GNAT family acetyltransferase [Anaerolineales bacterium]
MSWILRTFDLDHDYAAVRELWTSAGSGIQLSSSDELPEIRKKLQRDPDLFLVAESEGRLIGSVLGGFDGRRGMVYHLAVDRDHRRTGLGRILMDELEERLRAKGCLKYYLLVTKDNDGAIAFYRSLGWDLMDLHVMGKRLE